MTPEPTGDLLPTSGQTALRWHYVLLFLLGAQYLVLLQQTMKAAYESTFCEICGTDIPLIAHWASLIYIPALYFQLYKRRWWGWSLLLVNNLLFITLRIAQTQVSSPFFPGTKAITTGYLLPCFLQAGVVLFLLNGNARRYFNVKGAVAARTLITGIILAILLRVAMG